MRRAILNEQWLNGYVVNSNLPIGAPATTNFNWWIEYTKASD